MTNSTMRHLYKLYDPIELGGSLREVAQDIIVTEAQDVRGRWFHSSKDLDLYLWYDERDVLIKQQLCYFGQVIEWNIINGVKTGFLLSDSEKHPSSEVIRHDQTPNKFTVLEALQLIEHATALTIKEKSLVAHNFVSKNTASDKDISSVLIRFKAPPMDPFKGIKSAVTWLVKWLRRI